MLSTVLIEAVNTVNAMVVMRYLFKLLFRRQSAIPRCVGRHTSIISGQRQYFGILVCVISICFILEFIFSRPPLISRPPHVRYRVYVTAEFDGRRLGNQMFTYASMLGIAQYNNMTAVVPRNINLREVFMLDVAYSDNMANTLGSYRRYEEFGRRGSAYDISTRQLGNRMHTFLFGYLQSWRYFIHIKDVVRHNFQFVEPMQLSASKFLDSVSPPRWRDIRFTRVGIHVRRGDLLKDYYKSYGYVTAPAEYFQKAMQYFIDRNDRVQFVVCSDDISWCRQNILPLGAETDVVFSEGHSQFIDLAILASCDHVIISVGSFGWWAAWLANGTTIYYDRWPRGSTMLEYHVNKEDYFPRQWIPMY